MRTNNTRALLGSLLPPILVVGCAATVRAQTLIVFDAPNASDTLAGRINRRGDVPGYFYDVTQDNKRRGFVRERNGNFIVFDAPNATSTSTESINSRGDVSGIFSDDTGIHGFVRDRHGKFTVFDASPNASLGFGNNYINDGGVVTGVFYDTSQKTLRGFVWDGNFAAFDAPDARYTFVYSINASGDVTGYFWDGIQNRNRGYIRDRNGNFTVFDAPDAFSTEEAMVNDRGEVVGNFEDTNERRHHGFLRDRDGNFTVFDVPDALSMSVRGINTHAVVVGSFSKRNFSDLNLTQGGTLPGQLVGNFAAHGFLRDRDGNFTFIDAPNAWSTVVSSINDRGDVAGGFTTGTFQPNYHGMVRFAGKEDDGEDDGYGDQSQE